ncbi:alpha-(1,3)-fucosyltransferase C-like [Drosophila novamexicana]|uniref:alpha-(1,3)-fucosyltransferase C-like n=1 Tax=Drosophila novamexicana TaxID=47314 RepID=UPI0011E5D614|nr:alpha-(1,3)-fucosyltransferase C-like [Drosophila novamexicana]
MPADKIISNPLESENQAQSLNVPTMQLTASANKEPKGSDGPSRSATLPRNKRLTKINLYLNILKSVVCLSVVLLLMYCVGNDSPRMGEQVGRPVGRAILLWNAEMELGTWNYLPCGCVLTTNRDYSAGTIDAIVFNADRPFTFEGLDRIKHTPNFLAVFAAKNPMNLVHNPLLEHGESVFNLTMTYRRDSDVVWWDYFLTAPREQPGSTVLEISFRKQRSELEATDLHLKLRSKSPLVFYMMYEVNDYTLPESLYLQELRKHIELDAFIECHGAQDCGIYKFMLIFDPSACPDYVHPQLYIALSHFVVPVMIGGGNLSSLLPAGSYISSADFSSPKKLAAYLEQLSNEPRQYEQFFKWHANYWLHKNRQPYCALCHRLRQPRHPRQPKDFLNWWTGYQCTNRTDSLGRFL